MAKQTMKPGDAQKRAMKLAEARKRLSAKAREKLIKNRLATIESAAAEIRAALGIAAEESKDDDSIPF